MMYESGKHDTPIVPAKQPNNGGQPLAEDVEGAGVTKGKTIQRNTHRTQGRERVQQALDRIRQAAKKGKHTKLTALYHHIYNVDMLREAYYGLRRNAAVGVDGETWEEFGGDLETNLADLSHRLRTRAYRAKPVRRVYIPKSDGKKRPLGVTALEDKLAQSAARMVLDVVYETDFLGFSYGFRPGRGQHNALDALYVAIFTRKIGWVLDADIKAYFDTIDHGWLRTFLEHRIGDKHVIYLILKWLKAGVMEDGQVRDTEEGAPQGSCISPLLSNIFLHYVHDLWINQWRKSASGDVIVVRYADDSVVGFQYRETAQKYLQALQARMAKFKLQLHPDKTRLIEFGRFAASSRNKRGDPKPETFDFLGFTHICGKTRAGKFTILRQPIRKRTQEKLKTIYQKLKRRMHAPIPAIGTWLGQVVQGYNRYFGVPMASPQTGYFRYRIMWLWHKVVQRRSQRSNTTWKRMMRLVAKYMPPTRVVHPYPLERWRQT